LNAQLLRAVGYHLEDLLVCPHSGDRVGHILNVRLQKIRSRKTLILELRKSAFWID
jgi:hypothetical protein